LIVGIIALCTVGGAIWGATLDEPIGSGVNPQEEEPQQTLQNPSQFIRSQRSNMSRSPYKFDSSPRYSNDLTATEVTAIDSNIISTSAQPNNELTRGQRIKNTLVGASLGLMVGGAIVLTGGAACCIFAGPTTYLGLIGMTGIQAVSWGILAYDVFPIFVAPFYGVEIEPLELES